jgi:uncharacterized membrane protein
MPCCGFLNECLYALLWHIDNVFLPFVAIIIVLLYLLACVLLLFLSHLNSICLRKN